MRFLLKGTDGSWGSAGRFFAGSAARVRFRRLPRHDSELRHENGTRDTPQARQLDQFPATQTKSASISWPATFLQSSISQSSMQIFPSLLCEVSDPSTRDDDPLGEQQGALGKQIAPVTAELAAGRNDAMAGDGRVARRAHDVADGAMRARPAGCRRDVAIGRDAPMGNTSDDAAYSRGKIRVSHHRRLADVPD